MLALEAFLIDGDQDVRRNCLGAMNSAGRMYVSYVVQLDLYSGSSLEIYCTVRERGIDSQGQGTGEKTDGVIMVDLKPSLLEFKVLCLRFPHAL